MKCVRGECRDGQSSGVKVEESRADGPDCYAGISEPCTFCIYLL